MSGLQTATVETLTAEVRTLMVGSRQVTLSVYRQLDSVSPYPSLFITDHNFSPFGRVNTGIKVPDAHGDMVPAIIEMVGKFRGNLCRSYVASDLNMHRRDWEAWKNRCSILYPEFPDRINAHFEFSRLAREAWLDQLAEFRELPLIVLAGLR